VSDDTACVLIQSPNFFGTVEDVEAIAEIAHKRGALLIVSIAEAASLGIVEPPRTADIVAMERSRLGCRSGSAVRTAACSPPKKSSCGRCRVALLARPSIRMASADSF